MKLRVTLKAAKATMVAAAVMAFAFLFSACESFWFYPEVELGLTSVKIGDLEITAIPAPILSEDWDDEEFEIAGSDLGFVIVKNDADLERQTISAVSNVPTAIVTWGLAKGGSRPARDKFQDLRAPATFDKTDFFFFKVFDPDKEETKYYKFFPRDASPVKQLASIAIAGRDPDKVAANLPDMETLALNILSSDFRGQVDITRREAVEGSLVAATPQDGTARIEYAIATNITQARNNVFGDWVAADRVVVQDEQNKDITQGHSDLTFEDGNILAVRVIAQNDDKNYYAFMVTAGRMAIISNLRFTTNRGTDVVAGKGTQHAIWENVLAGSYASADQPAAGFNINIELEDGEGSAEFVLMNTVGALDPPTTYTHGMSGTQKFNHGQALAIRVRSARYVLGLVTSPSDTRYYKVQVNLIAANFSRHPQSAAYEITDFNYSRVNAPSEPNHNRILITASGTRTLDREIAELSFALDRAGTFTYQWYTANSWYGGYAFDRDGRIADDPFTVQDYYHPNPSQYDEKGNISFHNGGNQYYRLSIPGRPIAGANEATYKPTIDASNRPFIFPGFSNQTQYYWVKVTDENGLTAVSDRAAIVTEWNREFEKGIPKTEKLTKKHHIVDLHAYMGSSPYGLMGNPRNPTPFKAGNHGDKYLIPITFPPDFNVKDYSVVTCWAKFYLADGKEWIQNWTQGDFGFANAAQENLVLWYNVTNDNATRGLGSTGNEPQGGGLDETPAYLVVQPAGTKPMKQMPPFDSVMDTVTATAPATWPQSYVQVYGEDKRPRPLTNNDAQGWFTPYIEIVELRFEGPAR
jgi:hypothetical protein